MGKFEQIPASVKSMEDGNKNGKEHFKKAKEFTNGNTLNAWEIDWKDPVETLSEDEVTEKSSEITNNPETRKQVNLLKQIWKKYNNWELREEQKSMYENLMNTIKTELDKDVPTVVEMNKEIDLNYYMKHPKQAEKKANEIVNDYNNMNSVQLVYSVCSRRKYLSPESQQKLKTVVNSVYNSLNEDTKSLLKK